MEDPLALDMSKKNCNKILSDKLRGNNTSTKPIIQNVVPKPRKVEKGVILESICDVNDIESRISITKITNKLSSTDISEIGKVTVKSFSPEEVKEIKFDSRDVEMWVCICTCKVIFDGVMLNVNDNLGCSCSSDL